MQFWTNLFNNNRNRNGRRNNNQSQTQSRPRGQGTSDNDNNTNTNTNTAETSNNNNNNNTNTSTNTSTADTDNNNNSRQASAQPQGNSRPRPRPQPQQPRQPGPPMNPFDMFAHAVNATQEAAEQFQQYQNHNQRQQQQQDINEPSRAPPPAATKAIRQLPLVSVTPPDLVDPNNRECCICFESHDIRQTVIRLPCSHIYHPPCITDWLNRHCTCPVCRYELPTDNVVYERERKRRMKGRKPRYAKYELDRMGIREMKQLCRSVEIPLKGIRERQEMANAILTSGKIIIIAAPDPVEYVDIKGLRSMGVGKLKRAMEDAGVFFDSRDVVEKEDMVQIFVNSGRIVFKQTDDDDDEQGRGSEHDQKENCTGTLRGKKDRYVDPYGNVYDDDDSDDDIVEGTKRARIEEDDNAVMTSATRTPTPMPMPTAAEAEADVEANISTQRNASDVAVPLADNGETGDVETEEMKLPMDADDSSNSSARTGDEDDKEDENGHEDEDDAAIQPQELSQEQTMTPENDTDSVTDSGTRTLNPTGGTRLESPSRESEVPPQREPQIEIPTFASRSIGELRQLAASLSVDISCCIEKREIVELIVAATPNGPGANATPSYR